VHTARYTQGYIQADRDTYIQTGRHTYRLTYQAYIHTYIHTVRQAGSET